MNLSPNMLVSDQQETGVKHCPRCSQDLPLTDFGICRARKDRLNLYCRDCTREKVRAQRAMLKTIPRRKRNKVAIGTKEWVRRGRDAQDRVLRAIDAGAKTQASIRELTILSVDQVSDAIADLMFPADNRPRIGFMLRSIPEASWDSEHNIYYRIAA